ncbi:transcriptional regulator, TetR family [Methanoregula boonei 6A8]|jgi:AcrR family transcriptional regulator|uniref:Transcriptional regulator, TetR family n=1 Tax=Methanoregula boonei (strain DSM 21154 / JCM 14090 / 6A8) TaxID=456442 RepID=A7I8M3_METB6|nr:TetR/AcrR family transcriptional regulator [Methanoregula boonei]ABS56084.1 transcriptional regulator, TetR family [Methanoregula boonei 6A8]
MPRVVPEYKEDAKRRIIAAAIDVIAQRGCEGMTVDDVAKKIGVTKGAVYWYFPSKEELMTAVLDSLQAEIRQVTYESFYNRPAEDLLMQIFDRFAVVDPKKRVVFFDMLTLANRNSQVRHAIREYYDGLVATFESAVTREKKKKFIQTQADPHHLALMLAALYSGLQNYDMLMMHQDELRELWREGVRILLKSSYSGTYGEK